MITPLDIQNKEFQKVFRGYKEADVDMFLDEIVEDYENIYKENMELKDKIVALSEQIKRYNNLEETLKDTLIVAQSTADEVTTVARNKAEVIVEEAEIKAKKLISTAEDDVKNIRKEYEYLKKEIFIFKTRYKSFIEAQLITLDEFYSKIEDQDINMKGGQNTGNSINETQEDENMNENVEDLGA